MLSRSEASRGPRRETLRCAQGDTEGKPERDFVEERSVRIGEFEALDAREEADASYQVAGIEWFNDIIVRPGFKAGYFVLERCEGSKQHDG
jgi:hypothetical protein